MVFDASVIWLTYNKMTTKLSVRVLLVLLVAYMHIVTAYGQCDLQIKYLVEDLPSPVHGTVKLTSPDGRSTVLFRDTSKRKDIVYRLDKKGDYRLSVSYEDRDSLEQSFSIVGEEDLVEAIIRFQLERKVLSDSWCRDSIPSGYFVIFKNSRPSPLVKINYLYTVAAERYVYPGPVFSVINESRDTLYGEWLPGYFWGSLSEWKNGRLEVREEVIDLNFADHPPLYPDSLAYATVGSMGRIVPFGKYRFNLYYSTETSSKRSASLVKESDSFRWWARVSNWHLLTCDFEVDTFIKVHSPVLSK